jgi:predicted nucleic acid-binding Zn ribbon protein
MKARRREQKRANCVVCDREFTPLSSRYLTCSLTCRRRLQGYQPLRRCVVCGKEFKPNQLTCSKECRSERRRERRHYNERRHYVRLPLRRCVVCGKLYIRIGGTISSTCSKECTLKKRLLLRRRRTRTCVICNAIFNPYTGRQLACSKEDCRRELKRQRDRPPATLRNCIICGTIFVLECGQGSKRTCSTKCQREHIRHYFREVVGLQRDTLRYARELGLVPAELDVVPAPRIAAAAPPYPQPRSCVVCGGEFVPKRGWHVICSDPCRRRRALARGVLERDMFHILREEGRAFGIEI